MRANLKILRDFYNYPAPVLVPFGGNVATNLDPVKFPNLPVTPTALKGLVEDLSTKLAATITGGSPAIAAKNKAFQALATALDADADAVETVVKDDMEMLLSTGYLPASTSRTSSPLNDTAIVSLQNNGTAQALLRLEPVVNAKSYQVQASTDNGKTWADWCISTQARRIVLTGLAPGMTYAVRARAIGGSTGASSWTVSASIMSI